LNAPSSRTHFLLPAVTLWQRELQQFSRQWSRMIGVIASPLVFWILLGSGFGATFRHPEETGAGGMSYTQFFFPGTIILVVLFTAIFSTISIIEDRREGFLQAVLVAPITRSGLVLGKIMGGTTLALVQGIILLVLAPLIGIPLSVRIVIEVAVVLFLISFALTALGFIIAWRMDSSQGFHAIMNLFLVPMWLLSGAIFPLTDKTPAWLQWVMRVNPLTYGVAALRDGLFGRGAVIGRDAGVVALVAVALFLMSVAVVRRGGRTP
jgi:ABC-2 type transport system permease protein